MRRLSDMFLFIIILLAAVACQQVELPYEPKTGGRPTGPEFTAQVEAFDAQTKTALAAEKSVVWSSGDQIAIFQGSSAADKYQVKEDGVGKTSGYFEIVAEADGKATTELQTNVAIYPYEEDMVCTPVVLEDDSNAGVGAENETRTETEANAYQITGVTIPSTQAYAADSFSDDAFPMVAITSDIDDHILRFKNLCGVLRLQLKGTATVKTIELQGNDNEPLSGEATVTVYPDGSAPKIEMSSDASKTITLDCGDGIQLNETTATDFFIAIPPTAFEKGFNIIVTDINYWTYELKTLKPNNVQRSYMHSMPVVTIEIGDGTVKPFIEMGAIRKAGDQAINYYGKKYYRTPRYMRVLGNSIGIKALQGCEVRVSQYDPDYRFIGLLEFAPATPGEILKFDLDSSCEYIRFTIRKNSSLTEFECPDIHVSNVEDKEYREVRSEDNGYQKLIIPVNVGNEILPDYGILSLPETYSNVGEPTRLIIFCHGAAVNYPSSVTRFVESDLKPEYWLKEGYAVMDIEGNPFDNTNEHFYIPQAIQTYKAAYDWVTNTYNIRTDGVFLGGRSMGGGMCFEILQSAIPVVAACPIVPACNQLWYWNYCSADRKSFCAEKLGFTGAAPSWTSSKKMTDDEYQYLYDNFDKLMAGAPFWRGIENLPDKDQLFSVGRVSASTAYDEAEADLYSSLKFKVKAPVKIFTCYEDTTVPYRRNAQLMYNMLKNAGVECELSLVHTDAASPHRYELQDSQAYTEVTTSYGETMLAPWVYIEMLKFWRKYSENM